MSRDRSTVDGAEGVTRHSYQRSEQALTQPRAGDTQHREADEDETIGE